MTLQPITPSSFERPACRLLAATRRQMPGTLRRQKRTEALIGTHCGQKIAGHISRDATAIHAREKAAAKSKAHTKPKRSKRGRRRKDEPANPPPDPTRLQQQLERDVQANLADLPAACDWGCKKNSQLPRIAATAGNYGQRKARQLRPRQRECAQKWPF